MIGFWAEPPSGMVLGSEAAGQHSCPTLLSGAGLQSKGLLSSAGGTWQDPWLAILGLVAGFLCFSAWQELEQLRKHLQGLWRSSAKQVLLVIYSPYSMTPKKCSPISTTLLRREQ